MPQASYSSHVAQIAQIAQTPRVEAHDERHQLPALTGLRIVAALAVVFYHYFAVFMTWSPTNGIPVTERAPTTLWLRLLYGGTLGVDCFFVLSGFILAYTYMASTGALRGTRAAFWVARAARIYPVYLLGLVLGMVPFLWHERHLAGLVSNIIGQPLLLQAWVPPLTTWTSLNPPGWSLSVEAFCYLLFPFILVTLAARSRRTLWMAAALSCVVFAVVPVVLAPLGYLSHQPSLIWVISRVLYYNPLVRLPEFTLGVALGLLFVRRHEEPEDRHVFAATGIVVDLSLVAIALAVIGLAFLPLPEALPTRVLAAPLLAAGIALLALERGHLARLLSRRGCVWLGDVSYGVYILHVPLWAWLAWLAQRAFHVPPTAPALLPIYLMCVVGAAGLSHRYIETPARAAIRAWWGSVSQAGSIWQARRSIGQAVR
ncbi:MAG TPA: acyltransferase [Ktedonobacterales bacterium]|nr:acyltransferase [Ktedonobacterales bacterium]